MSSTASGLAAALRRGEALIGSGDIQSLADLATSFELIDGMRLIPFDKAAVLQVALAVAVPVLPLRCGFLAAISVARDGEHSAASA